MKRIVLLGARGQLGWELQRAIAPLGRVIAVGRDGSTGDANCGSSLESLCGDLARPAELEQAMRALRPDVIVNAAGYTDVGAAERDAASAHAINAVAPGYLARAAESLGAWLVHFSTDYIFGGTGDRPWREDDPAAPLNVYGRTKFQGEEAIRASRCRHLILRTSWIHSPRGRNFPRTILQLARAETALRIVDDQVGAPTGSDLVADVTAHMLRLVERQPQSGGTYHLSARGAASRFDCARFLIDCARREGWPIAVDELHAVPSSAFPTTVERPRNCRLDCCKLEQVSGLRMPEWQHGLRRLVQELGRENQRPRPRTPGTA